MVWDARLIAVSSLSGSHGALVPELMAVLRERGVEGVSVVVGGAIPPGDTPALRAAGVAEVFGPGRPVEDLVTFVRRLMAEEGDVAPGRCRERPAEQAQTGGSAACR